MKKLILSLMLLLPVFAAAQEKATYDEKGAGKDAVFVKVERMPSYPGGQKALFKFLSENVHYPRAAEKKRIEGRVICQFVIEKDGTVTDVQVVTSGGHPSLDKEAVRVLKLMPKWKPGIQDGQPVRVRYTVPVNFRLK